MKISLFEYQVIPNTSLKSLLGFVVIVLLHCLFLLYLYFVISPVYFIPKNLFFFDLIGKQFLVSDGWPIIADIFNLYMLWMISKIFFRDKEVLIPVLIYAISPWTVYLTIAQSAYMFFLSIDLVFFYGLLLIKQKRKVLGLLLLTLSSWIGMYSSFFFLILVPIILIGLIMFKLFDVKDLIPGFKILLLLVIPILIIIAIYHSEFKYVFKKEVSLVNDPGLLNAINNFQGRSRLGGYNRLSKVSENKYLLLGEYFVLKYTTQLIPTNYLTPENKLLGFSFSSPLYFGFLFPLLYGFYNLFKYPEIRKYLLLSSLLTVPSLTSQKNVDLNRLVVFSPIILLVISYGFLQLSSSLKKYKGIFNRQNVLLIICGIIFLQFVLTLVDISVHEKQRLENNSKAVNFRDLLSN